MTRVLLLFIVIVRGVLLRDSNIKAIGMMKECFSKEQAQLITAIFPSTSLEGEKREAMALYRLARLMKASMSFCKALDKALQRVNSYMQKQQYDANATWRAMWKSAGEDFERRMNKRQAECHPINMHIGLLSQEYRCLEEKRQIAAMALTVEQYQEEEAGMRAFLKK
jgi:hypothetical protein